VRTIHQETTDDEAIIEADPVQAEISSDEQGTNFEEGRTLVEKLFNVDTCGSTGTYSDTKLSWPGSHGGSSHQTPLVSLGHPENTLGYSVDLTFRKECAYATEISSSGRWYQRYHEQLSS
jgi:hypothetical protein